MCGPTLDNLLLRELRLLRHTPLSFIGWTSGLHVICMHFNIGGHLLRSNSANFEA